jgi:hypothetical protein
MMTTTMIRTTVEIECVSAEAWRERWTDGASWPLYTLRVTVDGVVIGEVEGWHFLDPEPGSPGSLTTRDADSAHRGLPNVRDRVREDDEDAVWIEAGDNCDGTLELPAGVYDLDAIEAAILAAADTADHGPDPELADADHVVETRRIGWAIVDYRLVEIECEERTGYDTAPDDDDMLPLVRAYVYDGEVYGSLSGAEEQALEDHDRVYADKAAARERLAELVDDMLIGGDVDPPEGMVVERDAEGIYVAMAGDRAEKYHLDADDQATVCMTGAWGVIYKWLVDAFGRRAMLAALREEQARIDAIIAARDPFVSAADSFRAGNCPAGSRAFAQRCGEHLGASGEVGGARASVILGLRDDVYTRRACREAARGAA